MEHGRYRVENSEGHSDRWFNVSLGLKEGCSAAPIEFSIYQSFIMKDLKSRLLENPDESVRVGFGSDEFNDCPLIRENLPARKVRWARTVEGTSKSVSPPLVRRRHHEFVHAASQRIVETDVRRLEAHLERRQMGAHHCRKRSGR